MSNVVTLRPVTDADVEIFYEHQSDPIAVAMAAFPARDHAAHIEHWHKRVLGNPEGIVCTVLVDGTVAGNVVSWRDAETGRRLMGYWIGREFWGRGVATDSVRAYLSEVRERPINAHVAAHNFGSQRVLEKNGFVRTAAEPEIGSDGIAEFLFVLN